MILEDRVMSCLFSFLLNLQAILRIFWKKTVKGKIELFDFDKKKQTNLEFVEYFESHYRKQSTTFFYRNIESKNKLAVVCSSVCTNLSYFKIRYFSKRKYSNQLKVCKNIWKVIWSVHKVN